MHNKLKSAADCTGCMACANACPLGCIDFVQKTDGFLYPQIDEERCVHCGKCAEVCHRRMEGSLPIQTVAAHHREPERRFEASSGGIFSLLAGEILERGGAVYGAAFAEDFSVAHCRIDRAEHLSRLLGSKYVQSHIGYTYREVKKDLKEGRAVLFSGTPCQIFGLKSFLGETYEGLICVEVICHGVPSPGIWSKYFADVREGLGEEITRVNFRDKSTGWHNFSLGIYGQTQSKVEPSSKNLYMRLFLGNHILRSSCYRCEYATAERNADITLGDCWGNEAICPTLSAEGGISVVILNTEKGRSLYESVSDRLCAAKASLKTVIRYNKSFLTSPSASGIRADLEGLAERPVAAWSVTATRKDRLTSLIRRVYNKLYIELALIFRLNKKG